MLDFGLLILFIVEICYRIVKVPALFMEYTDKIIKEIYTYSKKILEEINNTGEFTFSFKITRKLHNSIQEEKFE